VTGAAGAPRIVPVGERAGRLVATVERRPGEKRVTCLCDCGTEHSVLFGEWGRTQSCGCLRDETNTRNNSTHGRSKTPEYRVWSHMIGRCLNPTDGDFAEYGGRGIDVAAAWRSFEAFLADMGPRPVGTSLDRIDVNGNYEPGNCRWATAQEQANNRRTRRLATHCGNGHEWSDENTRHHRDGQGRTCRACHRENEAKRRSEVSA
jgi:hypothetical protein